MIGETTAARRRDLPTRVLLDREVLDEREGRRVELYRIEHAACGSRRAAWQVVEHGRPRLIQGYVTTTRRSSRVILEEDLARAVWMEATDRQPRALYPEGISSERTAPCRG